MEWNQTQGQATLTPWDWSAWNISISLCFLHLQKQWPRPGRRHPVSGSCRGPAGFPASTGLPLAVESSLDINTKRWKGRFLGSEYAMTWFPSLVAGAETQRSMQQTSIWLKQNERSGSSPRVCLIPARHQSGRLESLITGKATPTHRCLRGWEGEFFRAEVIGGGVHVL